MSDEGTRKEQLLDKLPLGIVLFHDSALSYANATARSLFGIPRGAAGSSPQVLGATELADAVRAVCGDDREVEVRVEHAGRALHARATPTSGGEVALIVTDVTASRRLATMRRDFVTNASHELKTPVAALLALADSLPLAIDRDPERGRRMVDRMRSEAQRLANLLRDLLDLARLEEAEGAPGLTRVWIGDVVTAQVERLAQVASDRGVGVRTHIAGKPWVLGAPEDIRLVAGNLLENAVRYNRPGGWVDVTLTQAEQDVVLQVADTGIGIPAAEQQRVFERFYTVDKGRSRAAGGTGLGLALVRHAVERAGGRYELASVPGEGSTFTVTFPIERAG